MYICICKQITDEHIAEAVDAGHNDFESISSKLGVGQSCGSCRSFTRKLIDELGDPALSLGDGGS